MDGWMGGWVRQSVSLSLCQPCPGCLQQGRAVNQSATTRAAEGAFKCSMLLGLLGGGLRAHGGPPSSVEIVGRDVASWTRRSSWACPKQASPFHSRERAAGGKGALVTVGDGPLVDLYQCVGLLQHPPARQSHRTDTPGHTPTHLHRHTHTGRHTDAAAREGAYCIATWDAPLAVALRYLRVR